jgi:hypothetical protein
MEIPEIKHRIYEPKRSLVQIRHAREAKSREFIAKGLKYKFEIDRPERIYPSQYNQADTYIYSLFGWAAIRIEGGDWQIMHAAMKEDFVIPADHFFQAEVNQSGWGYLRGSINLSTLTYIDRS